MMWLPASRGMAPHHSPPSRPPPLPPLPPQRPSRSSASRSKSSSTVAKPLGTEPLAELQQLQAAHLASLRRQSTANTSHLLGAPAAAAPAGGASPAALFAAAAAEGAAVAAAAATVLAQAQGQKVGQVQLQRRATGPAQRPRRLSTASEAGTTEGSSNSWSQEDDSSPEFTLRRTTARTGGSGGARRGAAALPAAQHHHLQPPASASVEQQAPTSVLAAAAVPAALLPEALPLLRVGPPTGPKPAAEVRRRLAGLRGAHTAWAVRLCTALVPLLLMAPPASLPPCCSRRTRRRSLRMRHPMQRQRQQPPPTCCRRCGRSCLLHRRCSRPAAQVGAGLCLIESVVLTGNCLHHAFCTQRGGVHLQGANAPRRPAWQPLAPRCHRCSSRRLLVLLRWRPRVGVAGAAPAAGRLLTHLVPLHRWKRRQPCRFPLS